jgi:hypothetical protein
MAGTGSTDQACEWNAKFLYSFQMLFDNSKSHCVHAGRVQVVRHGREIVVEACAECKKIGEDIIRKAEDTLIYRQICRSRGHCDYCHDIDHEEYGRGIVQ